MSAAWPTGNHRHMIFFPEDATTTEIYTLSLHDALPIAYAAANRYQLDDDRPYLWKTSNCGASWERIDKGITETEFTRVVREDPERRGLLIAGTERGVWFSPNDGSGWQRLQLNLPFVPVHALVFKDGDLV